MFAAIVAFVVIIFYLMIYDMLSRIANATEVGVQYQESVDRKLSALLDQLVDPAVKEEAFKQYNAKPGYKHMRIG